MTDTYLKDELAESLAAYGERVPDAATLFEVIDADPRRIKRLRLRNLPRRPDFSAADA